MNRSAVLVLAVAAAAGVGPSFAGTLDGTSAGCLVVGPDGDLDRVRDCMRMGRHVRVGPSISRGTAALGDGFSATGLSGDGSEAGVRHGRLRVNGGAPNPFSGLFAR